ncbi:MAG: cell division protein FtsQ [Candidatus Symbiothrix sp.]|jgi:cell division protein FtsQ|nr:cell division protein FtsQ [Candidatus Symbiothrix sp.]
MVKNILLFLAAGFLFTYMTFAVAYLNPQAGKNTICDTIQVSVVDTLERHYISRNEVVNMLKNAGLSPVGKDVSIINTSAIEEKLQENKLIKRAECYKTVNGKVHVKIYQRIPLLRVFSTKGNYYVDIDGEKMPVPRNFAAYVPVASGHIETEYAQTKLYEFALFLQRDKFWNSQIEQIYIEPNEDVVLTPTVGNHQIILGKIENYEENLDKLRLFYEKGLDKVGWNRYSVINLKFKNQVVCKKNN